MLNPDGYAWTWTSGEARFWRKNRSLRRPDLAEANPDCQGVDLNRNFDFAWGGLSPLPLPRPRPPAPSEPGCDREDPCSVVYCGPSAFSEPETQAVRDFIIQLSPSSGSSSRCERGFCCRHKSVLGAFVSLHSYSQMWFVPFGHRKASFSADHEELVSLPGGRADVRADGHVSFRRWRWGNGL